MTKGKNVLTTGDVARICSVAPRTVSKWFDRGQLKGYRIPGSKDRRIPVAELKRFMRLHNMPTAALASDQIRVLIAESDPGVSSSLAETLKSKTEYEVQIAANTFETGVAVQKFSPHVILVNLLSEAIDTAEICRNIRSDESLQTIKILALTNQLSKEELSALLQKGFDGYITDSSDSEHIIQQIEKATAIVY